MSLKFKNVVKTYEGANVLDKLSFELKEGTVLSIFGQAGSGLSSIADLAIDNEELNGGEILLNEEPVNEESKISALYPNSQLFSHLSIKDNYLSYLRNKPIDNKEGVISEVSKKLELVALLDKKPSEITSSQYLRALVGKALLTEPKVLIMDDALSKLDGKTRTTFWKEIRSIAKSFNIGVLLLTHNASEAMMTGDNVALLRYGKLMAEDTPLNLYNEPSILDVALAFNNPSLSVLKAEYIDGKLLIGDLTIDTPKFKAKHDEYYSSLLKSMPIDDVLYQPYTHALTQKHTLLLGLRVSDLVFDGVGPIKGKVVTSQKYGSKLILHLDIFGERALTYSNNEIEVGKEILLSLREEPSLLFDPHTKRLIK